LKISEMALTLYGVTKGYYEGVPVRKALKFEADFLSHMKANHADLLADVEKTGKLSEENDKKLAQAMESFKAGYNFA
ncbi:hypothetical protein LRN56_14345, partial [Staphylococcus aureus]|nr:hypothetical protein [Staphylococcus aureus]